MGTRRGYPAPPPSSYAGDGGGTAPAFPRRDAPAEPAPPASPSTVAPRAPAIRRAVLTLTRFSPASTRCSRCLSIPMSAPNSSRESPARSRAAPSPGSATSLGGGRSRRPPGSAGAAASGPVGGPGGGTARGAGAALSEHRIHHLGAVAGVVGGQQPPPTGDPTGRPGRSRARHLAAAALLARLAEELPQGARANFLFAHAVDASGRALPDEVVRGETLAASFYLLSPVSRVTGAVLCSEDYRLRSLL